MTACPSHLFPETVGLSGPSKVREHGAVGQAKLKRSNSQFGNFSLFGKAESANYGDSGMFFGVIKKML